MWLIAVDYFSRFTWAKSYADHGQEETCDFFLYYLTPIFGWPGALYMDNGSHFTGEKAVEMWKAQGVVLYWGPISHPSSTGLAERAVQMVMGYIR